MNTILNIHLGFAFFVFVLALLIGWWQPGRRIMVAVIGAQVLIGIIVTALAGSAHVALPPTLWVHIVGGLLAMGFYIVARRVAARSADNRPAALLLSFIGLALIVFTVWYGRHLFEHGI